MVPTDIKSSRLSAAGAAGATGGAAAGGAATGTGAGADAMFKPPNKDPPPALACGALGVDCGGGGAGAAGAVTASPKSNKFATGAGGGAGGAAAGVATAFCTGGIGAPPTGVATPKEFSTRLAGSRIALRL